MINQKFTDPNQNCTLLSAAMLLDMDYETIVAELDNGRVSTDSEYHIQEIQDLFLRRGKCLYKIDMELIIEFEPPQPDRHIGYNRMFLVQIHGHEALLFTRNHCVAWNIDHVVDPRTGEQSDIINWIGDIEFALVVGNIT